MSRGAEDAGTRPEAPLVVILAAASAGWAVARGASQQRRCESLLLDQRNHHLFQPLLYQVATAGAVPGRDRLADTADPPAQENTTVLLARAHPPSTRSASACSWRTARIAYTHLVVATGATHS